MCSVRIKITEGEYSVCLLEEEVLPPGKTVFFARAEGELSLVCRTDCVRQKCLKREDGWRMLQVEGPLDFSLVGILAGLTTALAKEGVSVFAVSTFLTDYLLVREADLSLASEALLAAGYTLSI